MRLLVVEGERRLASALQKGLRAEGFDVDVALDGTLGLNLATEHAYDLMVLDIMLPGINGYRICATGGTRSGSRSADLTLLTAEDRCFRGEDALTARSPSSSSSPVVPSRS